jgi:hypothetical protein
MAHPVALMPIIAVTHSRLPCCTVLGLPRRSEAVTTALVDIWPIMKPVSSKLYESLSKMPYLALMLATRPN